MLTYYDSQNNPIKLLKELGRGGEGAVYSCEDEMLVGKIYHEKIADEKAEKLLWMAENSTPQLLKTTAWVAEVLKEKPNGRIVGFLMPKIKAKEIHELYAPKSRRVHFPDATWHFLIHTATNLARAFHNLHKDGHVMGDVNQGNCVVTHDGTVKLIDCDSYGIKTRKKSYACEVGVTTHIPPELQGKNLRNIIRTENHDNFGLAVIIFQLLFLGRHPFAGNYLGAEDKTLEEAIRQHLFVYGKDAAEKNVVRPPGTLPLSAASPLVAELFERAFSSENNRPHPREWVEGLEYLAENLNQCLLNPGHVFYSKFTSEFSICPWCEIEGNTGLMLFPFTISTNALNKKYERDFDVATVEKLLESFNVSSLPAKLSDTFPKVRVKPSREVLKERKRLNAMLKISLAISPALLVISYLLDIPFVMYLGIAILINKFVFEESAGKELRRTEREKFAEMELQYDYLESVFSKTTRTAGVSKSLFQVQQALREYNELKSEFEETSKKHEEDSPVISFVKNRMQRVEQKVTEMLVSLRSASVQVRREQQKMVAQGKNSLKDFLQSKANVEHLSYNFNPGKIPFEYFPQGILFASMFIFMFLPSFSLSEKKTNTARVVPDSYDTVKAPRITFTPTPPGVEIPPETITDKEIAGLNETYRKSIINELLSRSSALTKKNNYLDAEKALKFAQRIDKNNIYVMNELGEISYNLEKYKEALKYLEAARKLNPKDADVFYLGMTYLQLERYKEAWDIFHKLTSENPSAQALYNLGTANMGLKNYKTAAENYNAILKISPGDTDAMYQLGICYSKLGDKEGVKQTYATLKAFDSNRADTLRVAVSKSINLDAVPTDYPSTRGAGNGGGTVYSIGNGIPDEDEPPPAPPMPSSRSN
jgi:DNA-binding helix-hairpin-helix protein with protein kinase domain/Flp pilus assembly protein TadD